MKRVSYLLVIAVVYLAFGQIQAQENFNIASINQYYHNWDEGVLDVCVSGDFAYLSCGRDGLRIMDISEPGSFFEVSQFAINDTNRDEVTTTGISGHYAYVGTFNDVWVMDISDPAAVQTITNIPILGTKNALRIAGNYLYVCSWGLSIVDISDPANAEMIWDTNDYWEVADIDVQGDIAYVAAYSEGLNILNIADKSSPEVIGSYEFSDGTPMNGISVVGDYAFVAAGGRGLQVIDLTTMQPAAGIESLAFAFRIIARDSYAYMTYGDPECPLAVIDISDPLSPRITGTYYPPQDIVNFALVEDMAYVADFEHGLRLIDLSEPANPQEEFAYNRYGHDQRVFIKDNCAIVKEDNRLAAINIDDPGHPYEIGGIDFPGQIWHIRMIGDRAYISYQLFSCLDVVDCSNPRSIRSLGTFCAENDVHYGIAIYDHYAYLMGLNGFRIVDISDPSAMYEAGFFNTPATNCLIETFDHYAVFQNDVHEIVLLDLSDPLWPSILGSYNIGGNESCRQAAVVDARLYIISADKFWIFDISNLQNWQQLSVTDFFDGAHAYLNNFHIVDKLAYLAIGQRGLYILDVRDAANPRQIGAYQTPGFPQGVDVIGNMAVVADFTNLGFYDCSQAVSADDPGEAAMPKTFALLANYPNPFNASTQIRYDLPKSSNVKIDIFDISGRIVISLVSERQAAGAHQVTWNASEVSSGTYFYRIQADDYRATRKMVVLK